MGERRRSVGHLQYAQGVRQADIMAAGEASTAKPRQEKQYDYLLKFLLVGDSDVGKQEILSGLEDGAAESPFCSGSGEFFPLFAYQEYLSLRDRYSNLGARLFWEFNKMC